MLVPSGALEFVKGLLQMLSSWGVTMTILMHMVKGLFSGLGCHRDNTQT